MSVAIQSNWRAGARADIARVIAANPGKTAAQLRALCRETDLYHDYKRLSHPYKMWLKEMDRALNGEKPKIRRKSEREQRVAAITEQHPTLW